MAAAEVRYIVGSAFPVIIGAYFYNFLYNTDKLS